MPNAIPATMTETKANTFRMWHLRQISTRLNLWPAWRRVPSLHLQWRHASMCGFEGIKYGCMCGEKKGDQTDWGQACNGLFRPELLPTLGFLSLQGRLFKGVLSQGMRKCDHMRSHMRMYAPQGATHVHSVIAC